MKKIRTISLLIAGALTMAACMKDEIKVEDTTYNRSLNFAAPIFTATADYTTILNSLSDKSQHESIIYADDEGRLYLEYTTKYHVKWNSILNIDTYNNQYVTPVLTKAGTAVNQKFEFRHKLNSDNTTRIDSMIISSATLKLEASALPISGTAIMTLDELTINGMGLSTSWELSEGMKQNIDLSGYLLKPKHSADSSYTNCKIRFVGEGTANAMNEFNFKVEMSDVIPQVAFGFFGQNEVFNEAGIQHMGFFSEYRVPRTIKMKGMHINLNVENHTGTAFNLQMADMRIVCADNNETIPVHFLDSNNIYVNQISYKDYLADGLSKPKSNQYMLDSTNSNADEILNSSPLDFEYTLKVESNPQGEVQENFITPETQLDATVDIFIPFYFSIYDLNRLDTFNFNFNDLILDSDNSKYVDKLIIAMKFSNGFPFKFVTQGYLVDGNYQVVDSLFDGQEKLWAMPEFDSNLRVTKRGELETDIVFDSAKIERCSKGNPIYLILNTTVSTQDMPDKYFMLYENYGLDMRLAIELVGKYKSE